MTGRHCKRCGEHWQSCLHSTRWRDEMGTLTEKEIEVLQAAYSLRQRFDPNFDLETERTA